MNEPAVPYVLTNRNSPAFWLIDNLWVTLAGSFLMDGSFRSIEQVCGVGIGGPCTHTLPMKVFPSSRATARFMREERRFRLDRERCTQRVAEPKQTWKRN